MDTGLQHRTVSIAYIVASFCAALWSGPAAADSSAAIEHYADIVHASYEDTLEAARAMDVAIDDFLEAPDESTMEAARDAWKAAREPYGQTEAYRFYGGPIDGEDGPEGLLNAWPLDEVHIDYVEGGTQPGIIGDVESFPGIDRELLVSLNESGAEENISTGYHAIEFLLWGQDLDANGAGARPYTDYTDAEHAERRSAYLATASDLVIEHLEPLVTAWAPDVSDNYRAMFMELPEQEALARITNALKVLSGDELAGERIFVAYDNRDQEDEQSCFSDNTHRDIVNNALGVRNVYTGSYTRTDGSMLEGPGLSSVVRAVDPALDEAIIGTIDTSLERAESMPVPFDQAIVADEGREQVFATVDGLLDQAEKLDEAMSALGLKSVGSEG